MEGESRHDRMTRLFAAAGALPPEQRPAFVASECGDDSELRDELLELLGFAAVPDSMLDEGPGATLRRRAQRSLLEPTDDAPLPEMIGDYRIIRVVGRGGMGVVYEAEQQRPKRSVALKVLRASMRDADAQRRFELEAEILGRLQHPGIASVLEAGVADVPGQGKQPFLAMELVRGTTLSQWARDKRLTTRQKIEMLALACDAVQHAHERGVIHRDLKPGNILVGEDGRPRVVDFGIARVTDPALAPEAMTQTGGMLGTLAYMAPEQARGRSRDIDARTDCWALGAIGWELVSGRPPHDITGLSLPEAARRISEEEVPRLSSVSRSVSADLQTVLGKALEKDPARRYASVSELAADLRRWLADEPILARPPSAWYQLRKFSRRHWGLVTGACLAVLALVIGLAVATWQAGVASDRAGEARERAVEAESAREDAERLAYRASLAAAVAGIEGGNFNAARRSLDDAPQSLRGWEWRVLAGKLDASVATATIDETDEFVSILGVEKGGSVLRLIAPKSGELTRFDVRARAEVDDRRARIWESRPVQLPEELLPEALAFVAMRPGESRVEVQDFTGRPRLTLAHPDPIEAATIPILVLPDGTIVIGLRTGAGEEERVMLTRVDRGTGATIWRTGLSTSSFRLGLDPSGRRLHCFDTGDGRAQVIDVASGRILKTSPPLADDVASFDFSPDGSRIIVGSANGAKLHLLDGQTFEEITSRRLDRVRALHVAFVKDGRFIVSTGSGGSVLTWTADLGRLVGTHPGHAASVIAILSLPHEDLVATTDEIGVLKLWSASALTQPEGLLGPFSTFAYHAIWSADGKTLSVITFDNTVTEVDAMTGALVSPPWRLDWGTPGNSPTGVAIAAGGILVGGADRASVRVDPVTRRTVGTVQGCAGHLVTSPDGLLVASAGTPGTCLIDARTLGAEKLDDAPAAAAAWSPDGRILATCDKSGLVTMRDAATRRVLRTLPLEGVHPESIAWSPDGSALAIGTADRELLIVSPEGRILTRLPQEGRVLMLTFTPDGERLLAGGDGGVLHVVDAKRWEEIAALSGHASYIYTASWSPDGRRLATASGDGTVRIWATPGP